MTFNGGGRDAFIASVTSDGTALAYAGYIGGASFDQANAVAVDSTGSAHVAGYTASTQDTFPVSGGPDLTFNGVRDAFVARVDSAGTSLVHASYVGGEGDELGWGIAVDGDGFIYIVGETISPEDSFPVTVGPDLTFNGLRDAFVAKLDVSGPSISADGIVNAASFLSGPIAPGEIISIFGSSIGPDEGVGTQLDESGRVATEVAGTQVLMDGEPVPLFFVRADQVNAQATYRLDGLTSTEIQIIHEGEESNVVMVPVAQSSPAFFTLPDDRTQVIAILPDGSLNSTTNPAQPGDVIVMYATGEGQTVPPGEDGKLAEPPFPEPVLPVEVLIGGLPAKILYFGSAPSLTGLVQINAEIPEGVETAAALSEEGVAASNAVPVVAHVGEGQSQDNANIAVGAGGGVIEGNKPPQANGQSVMTNEDTPLLISLSGSDPDGDEIMFSIVRRPANGSLGALTQIPPTGASTTYTPKADYAGPDSFVFRVDDGKGGTATAVVNITVKPLDDPPIANDDTINTSRNVPATRNVLANDSDPDGDPLTITAVTQPSNGSVTTDGQTVTYTPDDDFTGSDSFTYTISDGNSTDTATVTVRVRERRPRADLSINKAVTSAEFKAGQQATYTLTAINSGSADATNVTVTDTIPPPLTLVSATPSQGTCTGNPAVTCSLGTIPGGQAATVTIVVDIPSSAAGVVSNTAVVASPDDNVQSDHDTEMTTIGVMADLQIEKAPATGPVTAGAPVIYTLTVTNHGPSDASGVVVADTIPAALTWVSDTCGAGPPAGSTLTWTVGTVANGAMAACTVTFMVPAVATGIIVNQASVSGIEADSVPGNNMASTNNPIALDVTLMVTKAVDPMTPFQQGTIADYLVTVSHIAGTSNANNVQATDVLDSRLTFVPAGSSAGCSAIGQTVTCNGGSIPPGGMVIFTIRVMIAN